MSSLRASLTEVAKTIAFRHTKLGVPTYPYPNVEPIQLATLVTEIERLKQVKGNIVEIGVASGRTTRFLCEHIVSQNLQDTLTLYAIDTFASFTKQDLEFEVKQRGKKLSELMAFGYNDFEIWKRNFATYPFVKALQSDCAAFDYARVAPVKVAFLDVDLYVPTRRTLPKLYEVLVPGGVILVDDVRDNQVYDGAYQAYMEFCQELRVAPRLVGNKCGVIFKSGAG
jgi:hypothetical protein